MPILPSPTYHFGVYARILSGGSLLCVQKTRGPYTGLLDLPGGRPESDESWQTTLRRELEEELDVTEFTHGDFRPIEVRVLRATSGESIDFHHSGVIADVQLLEAPPTNVQASSDTAGWEWFDLVNSDLARLSALASVAVSGE